MNSTALIIVVLLYLGATIYLGWLGYKHTSSAKDYYTAGGEVNPYLMAMGYTTAFISTSAIVGFGGTASVYGFSMFWLVTFNIIVGIFVAFIWIGRRTRAIGKNLGAQTFPELIGLRFKSDFIKKFSAIVITVFMPLYAAAVMIGGARFMEMSLNMSYSMSLIIMAVIVGAYVLAGGMKGVLYTSAFQGTLMLVVMLCLIIYTYVTLGGISGAHTALANMAHLVPKELIASGHRGWTAMPAFLSPNWWFVFSSLVLAVGIGVLAQPQLAVRYMTVKSNKELYRALVGGGIAIMIFTGAGYACGPLTNVYFYKELGQISMHVFPNTDTVIPAFISATMPAWISYVFLLTLLSAAMSTLASQFHVIATSVSYDLYTPKQANDQKRLTFARYGTIFGLVATVLLSFVLPGSIIARATAIFFGLCAAGFFPVYLFGIFWKRITTSGAIAGLVSGTAVYVFIMFFINARMADTFKICQVFFGQTCLAGEPWNYIDPLVYTFPICFLAAIVVSYMTQNTIDEQHVSKCFTFAKGKVDLDKREVARRAS